MRYWLCYIFALLLSLGLGGCGGSSGSSAPSGSDQPTDPPVDPDPPTIDERLIDVVAAYSLSGDPAAPRSLVQTSPASDPLVKLGQMLFFSQSLSGSFDVACATCHLPHLGGSDGLSLSVGVVPVDRRVVGPARTLDVTRDQDPSADGGPNMHRNSITTFNAALFDRALMSDGRVRVASSETMPGGHGQVILTPEAPIGGDLSGVDGLLEAVAKFPIINDNEMRGFLYSDIADPDLFRFHLVERLKGNVDQAYMAGDSGTNWLALFRAGFSRPMATSDEVITLLNVQKALARYVESQIFVDTPWRAYLEGNEEAISEQAKQGALLFYTTINDGGLGCVACHAGDRFTNEAFYNVGFPQIGRGFLRGDKRDLGRWQVTRSEEAMYAHRVAGLLNVDLTAPYGHAGTFESLPALLRYHVNPRQQVDSFDFTLQQLPQFLGSGVSYSEAEALTREALAHDSFLAAEALLPSRLLSTDEEEALVAFLRSLTDICAGNAACTAAWVPDASEDPDGHMVGADNGPAPDLSTAPDVSEPTEYPAQISLQWPATPARTTFADVSECADGTDSAANSGLPKFVRKDDVLGLTAAHGFGSSIWDLYNVVALQYPMIAGGLTATYLNDDCWPDIVFAGGEASGMVAYVNAGFQAGFTHDPALLSGTTPAAAYRRYTGVAVADLNGDFRRELVYGNLHEGDVVISSPNASGIFQEAARLPMSRNTYGMSFGDTNADGFLEMFLAHWSASGVEGTAPAFWKNENGQSLRVDDANGNIISVVQHRRTFTPSFADFRNVNVQDLVIASDFGTSLVLQNNGAGLYTSKTDRTVITDENGMGATVGDFNNDGKLDWFVTSVLDPKGVTEANWGVTGNRLYLNASTETELVFSDATEAAGVRNGNWGWGTCKADFNNDGFLDIFHVNGFGLIPPELHDGGWLTTLINAYTEALRDFIGVTPLLFINTGNATFSEMSAAWDIDVPSEGRGVVCLDYDRDGDLDIGLVDHSTGIQFFENQVGHGPGSGFLGIRLVGRPPNTDAVGAKVTVTADVGGLHGLQSQMRVSEANSNFNSQSPPDIHFGLGEAPAGDLNIHWPDGSGLRCSGVAANQFLVFDQRDQAWPKADDSLPDCTWHADIGAE